MRPHSPGLSGTMIGRTYTLPDGTRGKVITRWEGDGCPRNVLIEREDGTRVVRPFRGLRKEAPAAASEAG